MPGETMEPRPPGPAAEESRTVPPPLPSEAGAFLTVGTTDRADEASSLRAGRIANLFCPGLGHLLVGRWAKGLFFLSLFIVFAGGGIAAALTAVVQVYAGVFRVVSDSAAPLPRASVPLLVAAFSGIGGTLLLILWSVFDLRKNS